MPMIVCAVNLWTSWKEALNACADIELATPIIRRYASTLT